MIIAEKTGVMSEKHISNIIFESISDGVFTVDQECKITSFNRAAEKITGFGRDEVKGRYCFDVFRSDICQKHCALRNTLSNGKPLYDVRAVMTSKGGRKVPINISTTILKNKDAQCLGAVEFFRDLSALESMREEIQQAREMNKLISNNDEMNRIFNSLPQIAKSECNVLIQGPSGSGKELVADAIHQLSPRSGSRFIKINCAALPANLLESELFGYQKGAFTDAKKDKPGMFLLAQGGTLLLDEIGEMPVMLQSKLLRVLNNGEFQPLGATHTLQTDARVLASTNRDIEAMIDQGAFREDLYYRLNIINIKIPSLKNRAEDIPILIDHFIRKLQARRKQNVQGIAPSVLQCLRQYAFPGNVRELENAIEHAFVMCSGGRIEPEHLPKKILDATVFNKPSAARGPAGEKAVLRDTLERHHWNKLRAAEELGMHRTTLWRKMKKYALKHIA